MLKRNKSKYHNKKVEWQGITFDSKREMQRFLVLKEAEDNGIISDLELQPRWELLPAKKEKYVKHLKTKDKICERTITLPIHYTADFSYIKDGKLIVEDVKSSPKLLSKDVPLRLKMMKYFHDIDVRLVYKAREEI